MSSLGNEPFARLPEKLQAKHRKMLEQRKVLDQQIKDVKKRISDYRANCKHEAIPGTKDHYATYCRHCGFMMDTWL